VQHNVSLTLTDIGQEHRIGTFGDTLAGRATRKHCTAQGVQNPLICVNKKIKIKETNYKEDKGPATASTTVISH
jgi:hypothetical protein